MRRWLLVRVAALAFFVAAPATAQPAPPLFVNRSLPAAERAAGDVVGMRLDHLFEQSAARVLLNVGRHEWVATFDRLDTDLQGHRAWVGRIAGVDHSHVSFAERAGIVSGLINAVSEVYEVRTIVPGAYKLDRVDMSRHDGELEPLIDASLSTAGTRETSPQLAWDDRGTIDVLLLYTARARAKVGGTAQMEALIAQIISDTNTIFSRSNITTRVRLVGGEEFSLIEAPTMSSDLNSITTSATARGLRDRYRADLVQLLEDTAQTGTCGIAWILTSLSTPDFNGYSVADVDCVSQYTPTHELGHTMGSHHAPEDNPTFALFDYSFGYKDPARGFRTVMAYSCESISCPRIPNMSNPAVAHNGAVTGAFLQNNALSINNAAATVANFRQRSSTTAPSAPTGLRSQVNANAVTLSWDPVTTDPRGDSAADAATSYALQVGSGSGLSNLFSQPIGNLTTVTGVVPAGTYYWRVLAMNDAGQSPPSAEASFNVGTCAVPGAPPAFSFSLAGRVVTLTWAAPVAGPGPFAYVVEAGSSSGLANLFNGIVGAITTITVQAPPGTYFVRVRAQNACGVSPPSIERVIVVP